MIAALSSNAQAILLLTAPLGIGKNAPASEALTLGEYNRLARKLRDLQKEPGDLLSAGGAGILDECAGEIDADRLRRLLDRGFLLSQSVERWHGRGIWIVVRADAHYPARLKSRLRDAAPPVLFGCGEIGLLDAGGLAVVGSRETGSELLEYAESVGSQAAGAGKAIVSGGARGIDQAAMRGALQAGGKSLGVLADSLERVALNRDHRDFIMDERLVVISACDPAAGFNVGHAMQRNKAIYALADAALVVNSDHEKGGTWAGAAEQLKKLRFVPVYLRSTGEIGKGLEALGRLGGMPWPNPGDSEAFVSVFAPLESAVQSPAMQSELPFWDDKEPEIEKTRNPPEGGSASTAALPKKKAPAPVKNTLENARSALARMHTPKSAAEVAGELQISSKQAREWLRLLVEDGTLERKTKPVRYVATQRLQTTLFASAEVD